ncbi:MULTISPECIES: vWA domain-containing protein [Desulfotignum]|uniref:vWA domain-containing protein n=1 Tax=Desulfotignum TaxID=115780 RepID=UPI0003F9ED2D|nr:MULTISPECIES: vWA domain-containing protein [Desulfotignum]
METLELAKLLVSLRKVVSHVGRNAGTVSWKDTIESEIIIDPNPVLGKYPVPASETDKLVGQAIHLAYKNIEMSDYALKLAKSRLNLSFRYMYKFELYFKTCESVYFDNLSNQTILSVYTEKSRKKKIQDALDVTSHPPSLAELFAIWWDIAAQRREARYLEEYTDTSARRLMGQSSLEKFYKKPIRILNNMVPALIQECPKINGVSERCDFRSKLYLSTWEELFAYIKFWPIDNSDVFLQARKQEAQHLKGIKKSLTLPELIFSEKLGKVVKKEISPIKDILKEQMIDSSAVAVEENHIVLPADNYVNKKLLQDLASVFKAVAVRENIYNRGLTSGSIDRRRLYRAHTSGTIFNIKKNEFNLLNDITLIIDATGSMAATNKWEHTQEIFQTLFLAIEKFNKKASLFAYNEVRDRCLLTELYKKGKFYTIQPHGKTASGEILKTLVQRIKSKNKKPIFIHITDGASNWGCPVQEAINLCKENRVLLLTIGVNCSEENQTLLKSEYGKLVQFAKTADQLPGLLRNLLNRGKRTFSQ